MGDWEGTNNWVIVDVNGKKNKVVFLFQFYNIKLQTLSWIRGVRFQLEIFRKGFKILGISKKKGISKFPRKGKFQK